MKIADYPKILLSLIFSIGTVSAFSQNTGVAQNSGVYHKAEDFKNRKLEYAVSCELEQHPIKIKKETINVRQGDKIYRLKREDLYGYQLCNGKEYRLFNNKEYHILNPRENLLLYVFHLPPVGKSPGKTEYYFSKDYESELTPLTIENLKDSFPENQKFHELIDFNFHSDSQLMWYDDFREEYRINYLLKESLR